VPYQMRYLVDQAVGQTWLIEQFLVAGYSNTTKAPWGTSLINSGLIRAQRNQHHPIYVNMRLGVEPSCGEAIVERRSD